MGVNMKLLISSTPLALWHEIIHDAESNCAITLKQELESYLVFLLMRYSNQPDLIKKIMASEFLKGANLGSHQRQIVLQGVGDGCLIFSGLFPKIAEKRLVKISYFVNLGQTAYSNISQTHNDLYGLLAKHFVPLMDILQSIRRYANEYPDLLPLQAYDLWNETGSQQALKTLKQYTGATPIHLDLDK
jgi:hypothetical protein